MASQQFIPTWTKFNLKHIENDLQFNFHDEKKAIKPLAIEYIKKSSRGTILRELEIIYKNLSAARVLKFDSIDITHYDTRGSLGIRLILHRLINLPIIGLFILKMLSWGFDASIELRK